MNHEKDEKHESPKDSQLSVLSLVRKRRLSIHIGFRVIRVFRGPTMI
jgi:hypothetical protein